VPSAEGGGMEINMKKIRYLVIDVDGTLTDGKIYMGNDGEMMKAFDIKDGCGIHDIVIPAGILPVIITGRSSKILENRCKELGIENLHQGIKSKIEKLLTITTDLSSVAYIGDDINDLSCMGPIKAAGGLVGCPADAVKKVVDIADFVSSRNGGNGAVREFIDWLVIYDER
jgi:3-deoxy-D-manno-octulosonate 8-phosphate phosphatase (KDO 8-P phosphatase)